MENLYKYFLQSRSAGEEFSRFLFEKVFISLSLRKIISLYIEFEFGISCSFNTLNVLLYFLFGCKLSAEKSVIYLHSSAGKVFPPLRILVRFPLCLWFYAVLS